MVFNNTQAVTLMQVIIFQGTHWICFGALLQKEDERPHIIRGVVCMRPRRWRSLHPMDGVLATQLLLRDV
jgi:hypothetical protein